MSQQPCKLEIRKLSSALHHRLQPCPGGERTEVALQHQNHRHWSVRVREPSFSLRSPRGQGVPALCGYQLLHPFGRFLPLGKELSPSGWHLWCCTSKGGRIHPLSSAPGPSSVALEMKLGSVVKEVLFWTPITPNYPFR